MVFTNGYAAAGNCAPSRACMLSGTYTPRHHVYAVNSTDRGPKAAMRLVPIPNKSGLAKENITFADAMKVGGICDRDLREMASRRQGRRGTGRAGLRCGPPVARWLEWQ